MSATLKGLPQLRARLEAIKPSPQLMRELALQAVREQKLLVPHKTRNLSRSIHIGSVSATHAETIAGANYAAHVEFGTRAHYIVPKKGRVARTKTGKPSKRPPMLRFAASPSGARLTGTPRKGAAVIFARRVRHPGTRPQPFMLPGATRAVRKLGADFIVKLWNRAA